jgi:hypothetical protein
MFDFLITCDNGNNTIIRARTRSTAIKMYITAEMCSEKWFCEHCKIRKIYKNKKFKLKDIRSKK